MPEIAEQIFDLPIRRGCPAGVGGLTDHVNSPAFATGVGLVKHAHRRQMQEQARESWWNVDRSLGGRLRGLRRFLGRARGRSWA
jgi:cell division ATPase FtsA